ncbi:MAG: DUF2851 family protein [Flavisolibacter sp.]
MASPPLSPAPLSAFTALNQEALLQFIWQFQYFNNASLQTTDGEPVQVQHPGTLNRDQGPDFTAAKLRIGNTLLAGSVELHLRTSDWQRHKHEDDPKYKNVILHVVYEHDRPVNNIPLVELQPLIPNLLLEQYRELMKTAAFIPCQRSIGTVKPLVWMAWKERLLVERLSRKSTMILQKVEQSRQHWEEVFWWLLARNFGMKTNADAFEAVARSIPVNVLAKHKNQLIQLEALLLGQAGLLIGNFEEEYPRLLQREYAFLKNKYKLQPVHHAMVFLRMRPVNFPSLRLAQLAALVNASAHLFSKILEAETVQDLQNCFQVTANDYWHYHYRLDQPAAYKQKRLGRMMTENIFINTVVPMLFAHGHFHNDAATREKALRWLQQVAPEENHITKNFAGLNIVSETAYDSQALIELKNEYCTPKKCLSCSVGNTLLRNGARSNA